MISFKNFKSLNAQSGTPVFDQFFLVDTNGNIKVSSNPEWQGKVIDPSIFDQTSTESHSLASYGLSPIYKDQFVLVTALNYQTEHGSTLGSIVGITEKENLQELIQPLNGLSPLASTYFLLSDNQFIYSDPKSGEFTLANASSSSQSELTTRLSELMHTQNPKPEALNTTAPDGECCFSTTTMVSQNAIRCCA